MKDEEKRKEDMEFIWESKYHKAAIKVKNLTNYKLKEVAIHIYDAANFLYRNVWNFDLTKWNKFSFLNLKLFLLFQMDLTFYYKILNIA